MLTTAYRAPFMAALACCVLVACSSNNDSIASSSNEFDGEWTLGCNVDDEGVDATTEFIQIAGSIGVSTVVQYLDTGCTMPAFRVSAPALLSYGEELTFPASGFSGREADIEFGTVELTALTQAVAAALSDDQFCGADSFTANVSIQLPTDCPVLADTSGIVFDVIALNGDRLFLGDSDSPARTPEDRPTEVDVSEPFSRVR